MLEEVLMKLDAVAPLIELYSIQCMVFSPQFSLRYSDYSIQSTVFIVQYSVNGI